MSRRRVVGDGGSAIVEFVFLAVLMLLPVVYLVVTLGRLQAAAFAAQGAAREAGRAFVTAQAEAQGRERAEAAALIAFADQGFTDRGLITLQIQCPVDACLTADARVEVHTSVQVVLPVVPRLVDALVPARIEVSASHLATVGRFGAR